MPIPVYCKDDEMKTVNQYVNKTLHNNRLGIEQIETNKTIKKLKKLVKNNYFISKYLFLFTPANKVKEKSTTLDYFKKVGLRNFIGT